MITDLPFSIQEQQGESQSIVGKLLSELSGSVNLSKEALAEEEKVVKLVGTVSFEGVFLPLSSVQSGLFKCSIIAAGTDTVSTRCRSGY